MSGAKQTKAPYPSTFIWATKPNLVDWNYCEHEAEDPVCNCVHDWRIEWGNVERADARQSLFITDSI